MEWRISRIDSIPLLAAATVIIGGLSFWGADRYIESRARAEEQRLSQRYQGEEVVVARRDLRIGDILTPDTLAVRQIPARFMASGAVTTRDVAALLGRPISVSLRAGDPLLSGIVENSNVQVLSASLAPGLRGVTFPVDEVNSFDGLLVPGDVIDLLLTSDPGSGGSDWVVRPIVQRVRIIATGKTMRHETRHDSNGLERTVDREFSTVTAHVTPSEAARIALAVRLGGLTAVLRNPTDTAMLDSDAVRASDLLALPRSLTTRRASHGAGEFVELIVGGDGTPRVLRLSVAPTVASATETAHEGIG
jgi:pilus assembly protein CpaB